MILSTRLRGPTRLKAQTFRSAGPVLASFLQSMASTIPPVDGQEPW